MEALNFNSEFKGIKYPTAYVKNANEAVIYLDQLLAQEYSLLGLDLETAALEDYKYLEQAALSPHTSYPRLIQIFTGEECFVFDYLYVCSDRVNVRLKELFEEKSFVAHNAVFELSFIKRWFDVEPSIGCTLLASKLILHSIYPQDNVSASLESLMKAIFDEDINKEVQALDWGIEELNFEQIEYAALDSIYTYKLSEKLSEGLRINTLVNSYHLLKKAQHAIVEMQLNGMLFDIEAHKTLIDLWKVDCYQARKQVCEITGISKLTAMNLGEWLENNLTPEVLDIWPRTDTGRLSTDSHTFADFDYLPIVKPFSTYQKKEKLLNSFGFRLAMAVNPATNKIHPGYHLTGTRTGRLSCSKPNLQQSVRDESFRKIFKASEGNIFICADFSQIELRVAAELSQDEAMLDAYKQGIDLHALTASVITGKALKEVTKEERQMAKAFNFGLLFGLGAKKFSHYAKKSYHVEISDEEAHESIKKWRKLYSGYRAWQLEQAEKAAETCIVVTPGGKRRKLSPDKTYATSMNHPVQGGAAECMLHSLCALQEKRKEFNVEFKLVNCVHDEIMVETCNNNIDSVKEIVQDSMIEGFLSVFPKGCIRDLVSIGQGPSWGEAK